VSVRLVVRSARSILVDHGDGVRGVVAETLSGLRYKVVLVAGDRSAAAFDHATVAMRELLLGRHVAPSDIQTLSASRGPDNASTLKNVLSAIERLHPAQGEGCLVFATSHGAYKEGLVLVPPTTF